MYVSDFEYFFFAADTCQYDCVPAAVRECEPGGNNAPAIVATFIGTLTAVVYCKVKDRGRRVRQLSALALSTVINWKKKLWHP